MKKKNYDGSTSNKKKRYPSTLSAENSTSKSTRSPSNPDVQTDSLTTKLRQGQSNTFFEKTPELEEELNKFIDDMLGNEQNVVNTDRLFSAPILNIASANNIVYGGAAQMSTLDVNMIEDPFSSNSSNQQSQQSQTNQNCQNDQSSQSNQQAQPTYIYDFTNSELFAFIASLTPIEFIIFETIIAIVLSLNLNLAEKQILAGLLVDLGVTLGNIVEQQAFQDARKKEKQAAAERKAYLERQNKMQSEIEVLQKKIQDLIDQKTQSAQKA